MAKLIRQLKDASYENLDLVGGKAASLGEMLRAGIPVPDGFVVTTSAFKNGMTDELKEGVRKAFDAAELKRVAVRSSAVAEDSKSASWAGQLESYLNVNRSGLIEAIEKCWDSVRSERAREYAREHKIPDDQPVAVVVQKMVESDVAGVMFTANPVTGNRDELMIEVVAGLGDLLVQGEVTPESIVASKNGSVVDRQPSRQEVKLVYRDGENTKLPIMPPEELISEELLGKLVNVGKKIEGHYRVPQDIEWAVEESELFIVQSRPITTLEAQVEKKETFEKAFTREESLMIVEILAQEVTKWLKTVTADPPPAMFFRFNQGLTETWLGESATKLLVDDVFEMNTRDPEFLPKQVELYKKCVARLQVFERSGPAHSVSELENYLEVFRAAIVPIHVIFFTPFREDTPKGLYDLAVKTRGEDALFDTSDLYVRDSLIQIYPGCDGIETYLGLHDLNKPDLDDVRSRENDFICLDGDYIQIKFDQFRVEHSEYDFKLDEISPDQKILKGAIAFQGMAQGKAQVIMRKKDVTKFKEGNVLVASMTTPHYLPAMRKAIAFVTDEGGVTCHAAIVAREMKKPCVIGTRIATQVIKEGQEVIIEAKDQGIVRLV